MSKKIVGWGFGAVFLTAFIFALVHLTPPENEHESFTIGAVLLLSGENALWGNNAKKAIDLIASEWNEAGGIDGSQPILIKYEDSKGQAKTAVDAFNKLVGLNNVPIVIGDMLSSTTLAMAPLANESRVPLIGVSSSAPAVTEAGPYVYRVWPSDLFEGSVAGEWAWQTGKLRKVGVIYIDNDYGKGLADAFQERFISLGGIVSASEGFLDGTRDFKPIVARIRQHEPDGIYIVAYYENSALIIKQLREAGVSSQLVGTSSALHKKLIDIAGNSAEGFVCGVVNDFDINKLTSAQEKFRRQYIERYAEEPDWAATHGGDAFLVVRTCIESGARTGEEFKSCIDKKRTFIGINSNITFDDNGDVIDKPVVMKRVVSKEFIRID